MLFWRSPVTSSLLKAMVNSQFSFNLAHQQHLVQLYTFSFLKCCLYLAPYPPQPVQLLTKPWFPGYYSVLIFLLPNYSFSVSFVDFSSFPMHIFIRTYALESFFNIYTYLLLNHPVSYICLLMAPKFVTPF